MEFIRSNNCSTSVDRYHMSLPVQSFDPIWTDYDNRPDDERNISYWDWVQMKHGIVVGPSFAIFDKGPFCNMRYYPIAFYDLDKAEIFVERYSLKNTLDNL